LGCRQADTHRETPAGDLSGTLMPNLEKGAPPPRNLPPGNLKGWEIEDEVPG
jgi:hypothetical protein